MELYLNWVVWDLSAQQTDAKLNDSVEYCWIRKNVLGHVSHGTFDESPLCNDLPKFHWSFLIGQQVDHCPRNILKVLSLLAFLDSILLELISEAVCEHLQDLFTPITTKIKGLTKHTLILLPFGFNQLFQLATLHHLKHRFVDGLLERSDASLISVHHRL